MSPEQQLINELKFEMQGMRQKMSDQEAAIKRLSGIVEEIRAELRGAPRYPAPATDTPARLESMSRF